MNSKNELGKKYGDYIVTAYTTRRIRSNRCVIWECTCIHCGNIHYLSGNSLRFDKYGECPICKYQKGRR